MVVLESQRSSLKSKLLQLIPRLCKKELPQQETFSLEAVIGVRFSPEDVLLVTINETVHNEKAAVDLICPVPNMPSEVPVEQAKNSVVKTEKDVSVNPDDEAHILIPKQEGERVLLPQKVSIVM